MKRAFFENSHMRTLHFWRKKVLFLAWQSAVAKREQSQTCLNSVEQASHLKAELYKVQRERCDVDDNANDDKAA